MTEDIFNIIGEGAKWLGIGGGSYMGALMGTSLIGLFYRDRITNTEQLEKILQEEKEKLGINEEVRGHLSEDFEGHVHYAQNDFLGGTPHIISIGGILARRNVVKHELYHIKKQHWNNRPKNSLLNMLDYLFRREPQAIAYGTFGLKL